MPVRGIRGAITVNEDHPEAILAATQELLEKIGVSNPALSVSDIASVWFTLTADLRSVFPAKAARQLGWTDAPLMCAQEIPVPGSLPRCVRVLIHWNTDLPQNEIRHLYLREAAQLRPDLID
ncbi:MAG: chorismate mutase [Anaerolineae bacterium]|nr:chorismate mutase [Anaerolineae bacterium]